MPIWDQVREAADDEVWGRGVRLARAGNVVGASRTEDEVVCTVSIGGRAVPFTVHLWPLEGEWSCDCPLEADPCPHVAAAAAALQQAEREGASMPGSDRAPGTVRYRFHRDDQGLRLSRAVVRKGEETPLTTTVVARARGDSSAPEVRATEADVAIDALLGLRATDRLDRLQVPLLFTHLSECPDVWLDGEQVSVGEDPVVPIGRVEDDGPGFKIRVVRDPTITEVLGTGVVRCESTLRAISDGGLSKEQREKLSTGISYGLDEVPKLVSEVIPLLRKRVPVDVRTKRLPEAAKGTPRIVLETSEDQGGLKVMPSLVYGDPPVARIDRGELVLVGSGAVPLRDEAAERRRVRELHDELGMTPGVPRIVFDEAAVHLVDRLRSVSRLEIHGEAHERFRRGGKVDPKVSIEDGRLVLDLGGADANALFERWRKGQRLVPTADGWAELPQAWLQQYGHLVANLLGARQPDGKVARYAAFDMARLAQALNAPPPPELEGLRALLDGFEGLPPAQLPSDLRAELRHYQVDGVRWLSFLREAGLGGILADDMGLGKTLQAICVLRGRSIVVAPTSVLFNWQQEIERFRPGLPVRVYHGQGRSVASLPPTCVVLTSYTLLRLDKQVLTGRSWDVAVLDEAQAIKNPESQQAQAAFALKADFRITMTGTPVENRLDELWSQLHFLNRGLLGGRKDFQERYSDPISRGEPGAARALRERLRPFVLRRLKKDVAPELPARTSLVRHVTLSPQERAVYDAVRLASREKVAEALGQGGVLEALEALLRLRQASCHPALVPGQEAASSSKVEELLELLDTLVSEGHKALVFSQWTSLLDLIEPHLRSAQIPWVRLDGSTRDRESVVEAFQKEGGPPVFLLSLKAGGTGLNLTAADHVIIVDPWWNPAVEDQASDRAHRIGQDKPVFVHRLVAEATVEERILDLQERKRALAEAALGEADRATAITREELLALLE